MDSKEFFNKEESIKNCILYDFQSFYILQSPIIENRVKIKHYIRYLNVKIFPLVQCKWPKFLLTKIIYFSNWIEYSSIYHIKIFFGSINFFKKIKK